MQYSDAYRSLTQDELLRFDRLTSNAMLASNFDYRPVADDVAFFIAVTRKVFQRGTNPRIASYADSGTSPASSVDLMSAAVGPLPASTHQIDGDVDLHPTYERPLWNLVQAEYAPLSRFLHPQAPLEGLIGAPQDGGERWVDFVLAAPWLPQTVVIELDGQQHGRARAVDAARDQALASAGIRVSRHPGSAVFDRDGSLRAALDWTAHQAPFPASEGALERVHGPAAVTRLGIAITELLAGGALAPGADWVIDLEDAHGWGTKAVTIVLDTLNAIAEVWGLDIVPATVTVSGVAYSRTQGQFRAGVADPRLARVRVRLEPFTPSWAVLLPSALPTVVIRGVYTPSALTWLPLPEVRRRNADLSRSSAQRGLRVLLRHMFGFDSFREGQEDAIRHALAGDDACVLLPTGAGKSLIYQIAGLLRPGVTIVIDPLVSLVDDQERRLVEDGVDRVVGLTASKVGTGELREAAYQAVADGDALVVFLTPERLQTEAFREALASAAVRRTVNLAVIDEAHCVSEWGHDFRTAYLRVGRNVRLLSRGHDDIAPPLLALTGTASPAVLRDLLVELQSPSREMVVVRPTTFDRPNLSYEVLSGPQPEWKSRLARALTNSIPEALGCSVPELVEPAGTDTRSGLVFVPHINGKFGITDIQKQVRHTFKEAAGPAEFRVGVYGGSAPQGWPGGRAAWQEDKTRYSEEFKANISSVLVSTKAFGMGIDKPNVRWTLHVGHPASLEGFAQESGRSGRDGRPAHCVLIASPAPPAQAEALLDLGMRHHDRVETFQGLSRADESDLKRQYYFLTNSYRGIDQELQPALKMLDQLLPAGPGNRIDLPMQHGFGDTENNEDERALFRLATVGIVDDYTIDYGARKYVVDLDTFNRRHIDHHLLDFVARVEPGRVRIRTRQLDRAPADLRDRTAHHLRLLLEVLYEVIEPARVRALAEMHLFASSEDDSDGLRQRLLSYLSDGPMAGILSQLARVAAVDAKEATALLDTVPAQEPREWIGAAARQLEVFPDHPILLLVRGLGEALLASPDEEVVATSMRGVFDNLDNYEVDVDDAEWLLDWACTQLRNQQQGRGWRLTPYVFDAWLRAGKPEEPLVVMEDRVLHQAADGESNPTELRYVLARRVRRWEAQASRLADELVGGPV